MTGTETEIQWYIAREGKQYGPLNDAELRMFIAGGHLRPTDLVWRPGMADWRQASSVFSLKPAPAALPLPPTTARRAPPRPAARLATADALRRPPGRSGVPGGSCRPAESLRAIPHLSNRGGRRGHR